MKFDKFPAKFRDLADILAIDVNKLHQIYVAERNEQKMPNAQLAVLCYRWSRTAAHARKAGGSAGDKEAKK